MVDLLATLLFARKEKSRIPSFTSHFVLVSGLPYATCFLTMDPFPFDERMMNNLDICCRTSVTHLFPFHKVTTVFLEGPLIPSRL